MSSVDVIIPCYNYARYLRGCVESVLSQSDVTVRVLVIDDASPDNTAEVGQSLAASDPRVEFRRHVVNKRHIATYNEGIEWTCSDYQLLLSADDYLLPGALSRAARVMDEHPEVGLVYGNAIESDGESAPNIPLNSTGKNYQILTGMEFIRRSGARNLVRTPTAVIRTALQKQVGGYRPELPHSGDMEMWLRLAAYASVGILDSYQAVYRLHRSNMSKAYSADGALPDVEQRKAALELFLRACGSRLPDESRLRKQLFKALSCDAVSLASSALNHGQSEISKRLVDWALELCPDVRKSSPWVKLWFKRQLPVSILRVLRPASSASGK